MKRNFRAYISGELPIAFLERHKHYLFFLVFLAFLSIVNTQVGSRIARENVRLRRELDKSKAKYLTKSTFLIQLKKRSSLMKALKDQGIELQEPQTPPKRVELIKNY